MQTDLFITETNDEPLYPNCIEYWPEALNFDHANEFYHYLVGHIQWQQPEVVVYGKSHRIPRKQGWMADASLDYGYSDHKLVAEPWLPNVEDVKRYVEQLTGHQFNSVLFNWYRNGDDKMGWHADDEAELGSNPAVATLSLGAERDFQFRHNQSQKMYNMGLKHGSLLLMKPGMQSSYKHHLPARRKVTEGRISLTFRFIQPR